MKKTNRVNRHNKILRYILKGIFGLILLIGISVYCFLDNCIGRINLVPEEDQLLQNIGENTGENVNNDEASSKAYITWQKEVEAAKLFQTIKEAGTEAEDNTETDKENTSVNSQSAKAEAEIKPEEEIYRQFAEAEKEDPISENQTEKASEAKMLEKLQFEIKKNYEADTQVKENSNVKSILLIGNSGQIEDKGHRLDTMALLSVNIQAHRITVVYFNEDIYLFIPGKGYDRLSTALVYENGRLLPDTLEKNFKIRIDQYIRFDFITIMDLIDSLGGVTLELEVTDMKDINDTIGMLNDLFGEDSTSDLLTKPGTMQLNGKQVLAYSKSFSPSCDDTERTEHQSVVVKNIYNELKNQDIRTLYELLTLILPRITTNFTKNDILLQLLSFSSYLKYDIGQISIPAQDTASAYQLNGNTILEIDLERNIELLNNTLYE